MDVDHYPQLDDEITEIYKELGLFSPDELEAPGNFTINNIRFELGACHFSAR